MTASCVLNRPPFRSTEQRIVYFHLRNTVLSSPKTKKLHRNVQLFRVSARYAESDTGICGHPGFRSRNAPACEQTGRRHWGRFVSGNAEDRMRFGSLTIEYCSCCVSFSILALSFCPRLILAGRGARALFPYLSPLLERTAYLCLFGIFSLVYRFVYAL